MIVLYQLPGGFGLRSRSPFCTKVETFLRMVGLEYVARVGDERRAPLGKLPYVEDRGEVIADSRFILEHCVQAYGRDLDAHLSRRERARGHVVRRTLEEHLYWALLHARWIDEAGWEPMRATIREALSGPLRAVLPGLLRRRVRKSLRQHGIGRHSEAQIYALGVSDLDALAALLEGQAYVLGEEPTTFDATAYAFVRHVEVTPSDNPLTRAVRRHDVFATYVARVDTWMREHQATGGEAMLEA